MYEWTYLDRAGQELGGSRRFADADAAEEWIGACWSDLADNGVEEVVLHDRASGRTVYRMGLGPE